MALPTQQEIGYALAHAGNYRVVRAQQVAGEGPPDGISGALLLSLGLRETWLNNIQGGAKPDGHGGWVTLGPEDYAIMDVGWLQISRKYHLAALQKMPAVKNGTWGPVVPVHTPAEYGYVTRFTDALLFTLNELHESTAYAQDHGIDGAEAIRFAVVAHTAGLGGALKGHQEGDPDKYTALGDYSEWVLAARTEVNRWLIAHPNWIA